MSSATRDRISISSRYPVQHLARKSHRRHVLPRKVLQHHKEYHDEPFVPFSFNLCLYSWWATESNNDSNKVRYGRKMKRNSWRMTRRVQKIGAVTMTRETERETNGNGESTCLRLGSSGSKHCRAHHIDLQVASSLLPVAAREVGYGYVYTQRVGDV